MNNEEIKTWLGQGRESELANLKRISKARAEEEFERLVDLIESQDFFRVGQTIERLERFFAPPTPSSAIAKDDEKWVMQAVADTKDLRKPLEVAHIEGGKLVATDGKRLHMSNTDKADGALLPSGKWISRKTQETEFGRFPKWERVVPGCAERRKPLMRKGKDTGGAKTLRYEIDGLPAAVNERFYNQLIAGMSEEREFYQDDCLSPIKVVDGSRTAVLMPIRAS